jgi:hypothetical protein
VTLYLILNPSNQRPNMRQQLNGKLIPGPQELLWVLRGADAGRRTGEDDGAGGESGSLGEEADEFGDAEDEVAMPD